MKRKVRNHGGKDMFNSLETRNCCRTTVTSNGGTISSRFSRNSEANTTELLENLEEMFPRYYTNSDVSNSFKYLQEKYTFAVI